MRERTVQFPARQQCAGRLKALQQVLLKLDLFRKVPPCRPHAFPDHALGRVDAAPASVPPWQVPTRAGRPRRRHVVDAGSAPGLAAQQPRQGHPAATPQSEALDRLVAIDRTGRQMAAIEPDQRRQRVTIDPDQRAAGIARQARDRAGTVGAIAMSASWAACRNHTRRFARFQSREPEAADICATVLKISHVLGAVQQTSYRRQRIRADISRMTPA